MKYNKYTAFARAENKYWTFQKAKNYNDAEIKANELFKNAQQDYAGIAVNVKNDVITGFKTDKIIILKKR